MGNTSDIAPVLVTGSGGFIGAYIVRRLSRDPAFAVIAATRTGARTGAGNSRRLDLSDAAGLSAALAGVGSIVHCAVGDRSVTVEGTAALLAAAAAAGVRRFVHISSVAVYGSATGAVDEATPMVDANGPGYPAWKAAAEGACLAQTGLEIVRLRPAIVYGPGSTLWVSQLARRIRSGRWGVMGSMGNGFCNLVHADDVSVAVERALVSPGATGSAFNISGTETLTWNDWFTRFAAAIGAPALRTIPAIQLEARVLASLPLKALARLWPGFARDWLLGAPARSELALFGLRATYPVDAARAALGWAPQIGIQAGLADCVAWLGRDGSPV